MLKKIAITGPESTGKSILTQQLADHFNTTWVAEYARQYINDLDYEYNEADILKIAKGQIAKENESVENGNKLLLCDTELIVTKIWSEHKYNRCDPWIINQIEKSDYHLYLLCDIDLPWVQDLQREHPTLRKHFFNKYECELQNMGFDYRVVSGLGKERLNNAIKFIKDSL